MPDYLRDVTKRLDRAKANFDRFEGELRAYLGSPTGPYRAGVKLQNQATGECLIVAEVEPHPDWGLLISDVVTDCRFALDHLAYQLVIRNTGQDPPPDPEGIEFPIFLDDTVFAETSKKGIPTKRSGLAKIQNMHADVQRYIKDVQPYKVLPADPRGSGIWVLHDLCNVYKHRLLEPALLQLQEVQIEMEIIGDVKVVDVEGFHLGGEELTNGTPLGRFRMQVGPQAKGSSVKVQTEPHAEIVMAKGSPAEGNRVYDVLNGTIGTVDQIVTELARIGNLT